MLNNEIYLFSMSRNNSDEILICRAKASSAPIGKNLYKYLKIDEEEEAFAKDVQSSGDGKFAVVLNKEKERAVFIFDFFEYSASIGLAVVFDISAKNIAQMLSLSSFKEFAPSDSIMSLVDKNILDREVLSECREVLRSLMQISTLTELELRHFSEQTEKIRSVAHVAASLVDVDCDCFCGFGELFDEELDSCEEVFDGRFSSACLLSLMMAARAYSLERRLMLTINSGYGKLYFEFSFLAIDDGWRKVVEHHQSVAKGSHGMIFEIKQNESGEVSVLVCPCYADVGFLGLKKTDVGFSLFHYKDFLE